LKVATVVPNGSPLRDFSSLKGSGLAIGVELDSIALAYLVSAADVNQLKVNQDFYTVGMDTEAEIFLPGHVSAVAPWDPFISEIVDEMRTGRVIDVVFPYSFAHENMVVRRELIDNVPDVVQALVDSYQEAVLLVRYQPRQAAELLARDPRLLRYSTTLLLAQTIAYNNLYKPTFTYPFQDFWAAENAHLSSLLLLNGQLIAPIDVETWRTIIRPAFMEHTYARLGWRVPVRPPWLPLNWPGTVGQPPYPPYDTVDTLRAPQQWPAPDDLVRAWQFAGTTYYP
jgi:ABC-type nitrate/sulfonate/bicarbonate transport system substrate-binding protein